MNGLHIKKRLYAEKWPVWVILMDGDKVVQCFITERDAREVLGNE